MFQNDDYDSEELERKAMFDPSVKAYFNLKWLAVWFGLLLVVCATGMLVVTFINEDIEYRPLGSSRDPSVSRRHLVADSLLLVAL